MQNKNKKLIITAGTIAFTICKLVRAQLWRFLCLINIAYIITRSQW